MTTRVSHLRQHDKATPTHARFQIGIMPLCFSVMQGVMLQAQPRPVPPRSGLFLELHDLRLAQHVIARRQSRRSNPGRRAQDWIASSLRSSQLYSFLRINLKATRSHVHRYNFLPDGADCLLHSARLDDPFREIRIDQCSDDAAPRKQFTQHLRALILGCL